MDPRPPVVLEYRAVDRSRRAAVGGLRLLGILTTLLTSIPILMVSKDLLSGKLDVRDLLDHGEWLSFVLILGLFAASLAKFVCAWFIAKRMNPAAYIAFVVVTLEWAGLASLFLRGLFAAAAGESEYPLLMTLLLSLVLLGWAAVDYEIIQTIRLDKD